MVLSPPEGTGLPCVNQEGMAAMPGGTSALPSQITRSRGLQLPCCEDTREATVRRGGSMRQGTEASYEQSMGISRLGNRSLAPIKPSDDNSLTAMCRRDSSRSRQLGHSRTPDLQKQCDITNVYCFEPFNFGVICQTEIENKYNLPLYVSASDHHSLAIRH